MTLAHIDRVVRRANPVPDPSALDPVRRSLRLASDHRRTDVQTYDEITQPLETPPRRRGPMAAAIAVAAAVVVAALVAVWPRSDEHDRAPVAGPPQIAATDVADEFLRALTGYDAQRAGRFLGPDALATFGGPDGLRHETSWREASGFQLFPGTCVEEARNEAGATVTCPYAFQAVRSGELGLGPYRGSHYLFLIRNGRIVSFSDSLEFTSNGFSTQVWDPFSAWVTRTHPGDAAVMYTTPAHDRYATSDASIALWAHHTREYVAEHSTRSSGPTAAP